MPATVREGRHRLCIAEPLKCICVVVRKGIESKKKKRYERNEGRGGVREKNEMKRKVDEKECTTLSTDDVRNETDTPVVVLVVVMVVVVPL
jgi:hypothetical protein